MRYEVDTHAHTTASGHAYSSVREMMQAAGRKGLKALALTEHAMAMPGTCHEFYFSNYKVVPREWDGVRLLAGAEANIMDYKGRLDMPEGYLRKMDLVIASLHTPCLNPGSRRKIRRLFWGSWIILMWTLWVIRMTAAIRWITGQWLRRRQKPEQSWKSITVPWFPDRPGRGQRRITGRCWNCAGDIGCISVWEAMHILNSMQGVMTVPTVFWKKYSFRRNWY